MRWYTLVLLTSATRWQFDGNTSLEDPFHRAWCTINWYPLHYFLSLTPEDRFIVKSLHKAFSTEPLAQLAANHIISSSHYHQGANWWWKSSKTFPSATAHPAQWDATCNITVTRAVVSWLKLSFLDTRSMSFNCSSQIVKRGFRTKIIVHNLRVKLCKSKICISDNHYPQYWWL